MQGFFSLVYWLASEAAVINSKALASEDVCACLWVCVCTYVFVYMYLHMNPIPDNL